MQIYLVVPLFCLLAILLLSGPLLCLLSYYRERRRNTEGHRSPLRLPFYHHRHTISNAETIELRPIHRTGKSESNDPTQNPPHAKVKPIGKQPELSRSRSSHSAKSFVAPVKDFHELPGPNPAAARAVFECDIGRSDTQKTNISTASTIVSDEMRKQSIATANSGPLPKIMPNEHGYFESASSAHERSELLNRPQGDSTKMRSKSKGKFTEQFQRSNSQRGAKREGEGKFEDIELGGDAAKDFA